MNLSALTELLALDPADPISHGRLQAMRYELGRGDPEGRRRLDDETRRLLDELLATPTRQTAHKGSVPWWDVHRRPTPPGHPAPERQPLTESDYRWLDRLPTDPSKISDSDARTLTRMLLNVEPGSADERLVATYWDPLADYHEQKIAEQYVSELRRVHSPVPPHPSSALGALASAIAAETPELTSDEAYSRARSQLAHIARERAARHAGVLAKAEADAAPRPIRRGESVPERRPAIPSTWSVPAS